MICCSIDNRATGTGNAPNAIIQCDVTIRSGPCLAFRPRQITELQAEKRLLEGANGN